jgi:hypothetical protein
MLMLQAGTAVIFAVVALSLMIMFTVNYAPEGDVGTFMTGNCLTVGRWNSFWHAVLNVASMLFLGAGNYCMQVLVAPSREEVNKAHREGRSMDIGIHSLGNILRISSKRRITWFILGVVSTSMHLL